MTPHGDLDGLVAVITGAAGGVGRACVKLFVEKGAAVVAEDIDPAVAELEQPGRVLHFVGDIRDPRTAETAVRQAVDHFGRLDVLVNNAAVIVSKCVLSTSDEEWANLMAVNVNGVFYHCRAALSHFASQRRGAVINVTSISGVVGLPQQAAYCASKGAVVQLTRQLAVDFAGRGIRVNSVAPGAIDTPFLARHLQAQDDPKAAEIAVNDAHPLGRYAAPAEIAEVIVFLASPAASFITGAVIAADGGYTAR